jgi:hypothetical protein
VGAKGFFVDVRVGIKEVRGKVLGYILTFGFKFNGFWEKIARATSVIIWGKIHNDDWTVIFG